MFHFKHREQQIRQIRPLLTEHTTAVVHAYDPVTDATRQLAADGPTAAGVGYLFALSQRLSSALDHPSDKAVYHHTMSGLRGVGDPHDSNQSIPSLTRSNLIW